VLLPEILQQALNARQRGYGFYLEEVDDHTLFLMLKDERVAKFSSTGATQLAIQDAADRRIEQDENLFTFERVEA